MITANCRDRFTAEDFDFVVQTLARSERDSINLVDLLTDGVLGVADFQARQLLGTDHYARLTVELGRNIAMDDPGKISELQRLGADANIDDALRLINGW